MSVQHSCAESVKTALFGSRKPFPAGRCENMRSMHDTNHKGNVAEMVIATEAMKLGVHVMKPLAEHTRYDLIFDVDGRLLRVQ
jgi:hypothetical protein